MSPATEFPWDGVSIAALTLVCIFGFGWVLIKLTSIVTTARDDLRDRYCGRAWQPDAIDFLTLPLWLLLEALCLIVGLAVALLIALIAYQAAKDARDWWHEGGRRGGR